MGIRLFGLGKSANEAAKVEEPMTKLDTQYYNSAGMKEFLQTCTASQLSEIVAATHANLPESQRVECFCMENVMDLAKRLSEYAATEYMKVLTVEVQRREVDLQLVATNPEPAAQAPLQLVEDPAKPAPEPDMQAILKEDRDLYNLYHDIRQLHSVLKAADGELLVSEFTIPMEVRLHIELNVPSDSAKLAGYLTDIVDDDCVMRAEGIFELGSKSTVKVTNGAEDLYCELAGDSKPSLNNVDQQWLVAELFSSDAAVLYAQNRHKQLISHLSELYPKYTADRLKSVIDYALKPDK